MISQRAFEARALPSNPSISFFSKNKDKSKKKDNFIIFKDFLLLIDF